MQALMALLLLCIVAFAPPVRRVVERYDGLGILRFGRAEVFLTVKQGCSGFRVWFDDERVPEEGDRIYRSLGVHTIEYDNGRPPVMRHTINIHKSEEYISVDCASDHIQGDVD